MTVVDYINRKNDITEKYTGIRIVPEDQIIEVELVNPLSFSSAGSCPYCQVWNDARSCIGCPMAEADNECSVSKDSSYTAFYIARRLLPLIQKEALTSELNALVREFNTTYNFKPEGE